MARTGLVPASILRDPITVRVDGTPPIIEQSQLAAETRMRVVSSVLRQVNIPLARRIRDVLQLDAKQLSALMIRAHAVLPEDEFALLGGAWPDSDRVTRFMRAVAMSSFCTNPGPIAAEEFKRLYMGNSGLL